MIRAALALARLARAAAHVLHGVGLVIVRFPRLDAAGRALAVQAWSARLLALVGVQFSVQGQPRPGAALLIANHVSWLDIAVIHAACPQARFVSKASVRHWPLVGRLAGAVGTLFIERERKRDALRVVHEVAAALQRGEVVAVFPEGTTGAGATVLPFHANLLQAAIAAEAPVQPVALRYHAPGERFARAAQYIDDTTLIASAWRVASAQGLAVQVRFLPPEGCRHADRRALAEHLRQQVQQALDEPA